MLTKIRCEACGTEHLWSVGTEHENLESARRSGWTVMARQESVLSGLPDVPPAVWWDGRCPSHA